MTLDFASANDVYWKGSLRDAKRGLRERTLIDRARGRPSRKIHIWQGLNLLLMNFKRTGTSASSCFEKSAGKK